MPVTPASAGKRRRKSGSPQTPQVIVPAGSDLTILVKPKQLGGIVHQLQPCIIPEIIARFGFKWHYSAINKDLPPIIRSTIKCFNIGGYGPSTTSCARLIRRRKSKWSGNCDPAKLIV